MHSILIQNSYNIRFIFCRNEAQQVVTLHSTQYLVHTVQSTVINLMNLSLLKHWPIYVHIYIVNIVYCLVSMERNT